MTVSERSRRPEGSHPPAPTDQNGSGGDDIYAAAAASAAGRSKSSGAAATKPRKSSSSSSAGTQRTASGSNGSSPAKSSSTSPNRPKPSAVAAGGGAGAATAVATAPEETAAQPAVSADEAPEADAEETKPVKAEKKAKSEKVKADKPKAGAARGTRKARLRLSRLDPWSVMKTSFMFSIAAGIVLVVAVYAVWLVVGSSGLFDSIDSIVGSVLQSPGDTTPFRIGDYVNTQKVMGVAAFLACIDVVIFTALATLASFLYNLAATMLGGLEVTLAED
jgi:hypothetical protein